MNKFHAYAAIQTCVLAGDHEIDDGRSVYFALLKQSPDITEHLTRTEIEKAATAFITGLKKVTFAVERRAMELQAEEAMLRADLIEELGKVDVAEPRTAREVLQTINSTVASSGEPSLVEAIDCLDGADVEVKELRARLAKLFPPGPEDTKPVKDPKPDKEPK